MSHSTPKITAKFAILDVKRGRKKLLALVKDHKQQIPITLTGNIVGDWSKDDGESIEFQIDVISHKLGKAKPQSCECPRCRAIYQERIYAPRAK